MILYGSVLYICGCAYINIYAYPTTYTYKKHTHWAAPRLLTLRVFPHISLQVRIIFFLFHLVYGCPWPKCFVQVEFLTFSLGGF